MKKLILTVALAAIALFAFAPAASAHPKVNKHIQTAVVDGRQAQKHLHAAFVAWDNCNFGVCNSQVRQYRVWLARSHKAWNRKGTSRQAVLARRYFVHLNRAWYYWYTKYNKDIAAGNYGRAVADEDRAYAELRAADKAYKTYAAYIVSLHWYQVTTYTGTGSQDLTMTLPDGTYKFVLSGYQWEDTPNTFELVSDTNSINLFADDLTTVVVVSDVSGDVLPGPWELQVTSQDPWTVTVWVYR